MDKLNASVEYIFLGLEIVKNDKMFHSITENQSANGTLDFFLDFDSYLRGALYSYKQEDLCYRLGKPPRYSITEMVLFLPFDG